MRMVLLSALLKTVLMPCLVILPFSGMETCLHLHTKRLIQASAGEDMWLHCQFQYNHNFTQDEVYILWGKELALDEYKVIIIFNGQDVKSYRENSVFPLDKLQSGKADLLLKKVEANESGMYLCDVTVKAANGKGKTYMQVLEKGHSCVEEMQLPEVQELPNQFSAQSSTTRSYSGVIISAMLLLGVALAAVGYVLYKKRVTVPRDSP
ncbi:uncharacterized protein LOC115088184 [Rhinatrema bivittatum]|uniref:uncharacterized protein LOC115088184 n=1 Tax=Rhinatrema bivittatum TaxID=194408 RepID=UPI001126AD80|nr:uncharacterized protein LOC115088184 [Rhinatrema bivittatum]